MQFSAKIMVEGIISTKAQPRCELNIRFPVIRKEIYGLFNPDREESTYVCRNINICLTPFAVVPCISLDSNKHSSIVQYARLSGRMYDL